MIPDVEEVEVVVAHSERATLRVGDVFLKVEPLPSTDPTAGSDWIDLAHGVYYPVTTAPD